MTYLPFRDEEYYKYSILCPFTISCSDHITTHSFSNYLLFYCKVLSQALYMVMKSQKEAKAEFAAITKTLKERLSINNLFREFEVVTNMTRKLEIKWKAFARLQPIRHLPREDAAPFLTHVKGRTGSPDDDSVRIQYENSQKVLLVTGITNEAIEEMLREFNSRGSAQYPHQKAVMTAKIVANNGYWVTIETNAEDTAFYLKKFLRSRKKTNDIANSAYKMEGKRIRIVILQEDFFSILVDAMTELKSETFRQAFVLAQLPNERRKSLDENQMQAETKKSNITYHSVAINYYGKGETKDEQLSDGFSESNSLNSDILDSSKLKDLIETSEQGIQSQNNAEYEGSLENTSEREEKEQNRSRQHLQPSQIKPQTAKIEEKRQKSEILRNQIEQQLINSQNDQKQAIFSPVKQNKQQPFSRKACSAKELGSPDNPFINTIRVPSLETAPTAAIQTQETQYSSIPYTLMKRLLVQFKQIRSSQLVELPNWMQSESEEQRSRHKFFGSLCRPKIAQRRGSPFQ